MLRRHWLFLTAFSFVVTVAFLFIRHGSRQHAGHEKPTLKPIANAESELSSDKTAQDDQAESNSSSKSGTALRLETRVIVRPWPKVSAEETVFLNSLKPRKLTPKEPLHIPDGRDLRVTVKLVDQLKGRADPRGRLVIHGDNSLSVPALNRVADTYNMQFHRLHSVSDEQIAGLTRRAAEKTGEAQADLAAMIEIRVPSSSREKLVALATEMHAMAEVEWVELEAMDLLPPPPAEDIAPPTPLLVNFQTYRQAEMGVDMDYIWNTYGIRGDHRIRVTDCEYDFDLEHEDLAGIVSMQPNVVSRYTNFGMGHGTSVLGILASADNGYGTSGGAPDCDFWFFPESATLTTGTQSRAACVLAAITASREGDIVVLEMQTQGPDFGTTDYVPAEYNQSVWTSVRTGTNAGVLTVAAAGNGNQNLDDETLFSSYNARGDSGAILVGAGDNARVKRSFSTYGSRVDVQAWGGGVFTTASTTSGTYVYGADARQSYTASFSGTSSATPIVASAAALLKSVALNISGVRLTPAEVRHLLKTTGRTQTGNTTAAIGPLPNLQAASEALFALHPPRHDSISNWGQDYLGTAEPDLTADDDGDGLANMLEYLFGMDPAQNLAEDAASKPYVYTVTSPGNGTTAILEFQQPVPRKEVIWAVQKSSSLLTDSWQDVIHEMDGATIRRNGNLIRVTVPPTSAGERTFLRVKAWITPSVEE